MAPCWRAAALGALACFIATPGWGHEISVEASHLIQYGFGVLIIVQTLLIVALIAQLRRRSRKEEEEQKQHAEITHAARLALVGEITASVAHEVTQPLSAILNNIETAQFLLRQQTPNLNALADILSDVRHDDIRAHRIVERLRVLLRKREMHLEYVDVNVLTENALTLLEPDAARRDVTIRTSFERDLPPVPADPIHLEQVVLNLVINAMDAMSETPQTGRSIEIRTKRQNDHCVQVEIADDGPGIEPEHIDEIFDSFFTTKRDGMGLGLSIVKSIINMHGGAISARNRSAGGAVFAFTLPTKRPTINAVDSSPSILIAPQVPREVLAQHEQSKGGLRTR